MTPTTFIKEVNYLFSIENLYQIEHECPEKIASQKLNRKFKAFIKSQFPGYKLHGFSSGYCCSSGFVERDGKFVYISLPDLRYRNNWANDVLIRIADNEQDFTGYTNNHSSITNLVSDVNRLLGL